jgi:catechol-2,3-dioxygenase
MPAGPAVTFSHIGLHCFDLEKMTDFYTRVVGLTETDRGEINVTAAPFAGLDLDMVFLSGEPRDHHQIALVGNPGRNVEPGGALLNQVSFRLDSLDTLRSRVEAVKAEGITGIAPISHGNAWSVYFPDPEGNTIEMFVDTPWYVHQPRADELDLSKTNDEIIAWTEASIRDEPSFKSADAWRKEIGKKMGVKTPVGV